MSEMISVNKVDVGINSSLPSDKVTWATGRNVRFTPGYVSKTLGKSVLGKLFYPSLPIRSIFSFSAFDGTIYNVICTDAKTFAADELYTTFTNITPSSAPGGGVLDIWDCCIVAGLPILTNGKDTMLKWTSASAILSPMTHGVVAKNISNCMHQLVCSNIVEDGYTYTGRVRWMERGNPENSTIDTSKKSGYQDLTTYENGYSVQENIIAQVSEGSSTYFFTEKNVWLCDFSQSTKSFVIIDNDFKLLTKKSVCVYQGVVYALEKRDIYKFSKGQGKVPIGLPIRTELFTNLNASGSVYAFCFPMYNTKEIWFCVSTTNAQPNTAYVYNWELDCWSICDCTFICHAFYENSTNNALIGDVVGDLYSTIYQMDSGFDQNTAA